MKSVWPAVVAAAWLAAVAAGNALAQSTPSNAASPPKAAESKAGDARLRTPEETIRARVEQRIGGKPSSIVRMPFGLYEVVIDSDIFYVDANVNYVLVGRAIDARTREDLTEKRRDEILRVDFKSLPLDLAVKTVRGNGSRVFVVFADPNCPYCKRLERDLVMLDNVTMYTFLYPILSPDSMDKSKAVWCSNDRAAAWQDMMVNGKTVPPAPADCVHPLQKTLALGQKLNVTGTPTIVFTDGRRLPGAVPLSRIEQMLTASANPSTAKAQ